MARGHSSAGVILTWLEFRRDHQGGEFAPSCFPLHFGQLIGQHAFKESDAQHNF
jgi:hypothetical protein